MASYDKPAMVWWGATKALNTTAFVDDLDIPQGLPEELLTQYAEMVNAFGTISGSGGGGGQTINGYGYGHSG